MTYKHLKRGRSSGYAMIEYLIVLPVLLMLLFMVVEFADFFWKKLTLTHAVYAAVQECSRARPEKARELFETNYNRADIGQEGEILKNCELDELDSTITLVTFTAQDTFLLDIPLFPIPGGVTIEETASMVKE